MTIKLSLFLQNPLDSPRSLADRGLPFPHILPPHPGCSRNQQNPPIPIDSSTFPCYTKIVVQNRLATPIYSRASTTKMSTLIHSPAHQLPRAVVFSRRFVGTCYIAQP